MEQKLLMQQNSNFSSLGLITEPACRTLVLENDKFYITLINQGGDDSFDLKQICQQWIQRETEDTKLIEFLKGIGVESMTEK